MDAIEEIKDLKSLLDKGEISAEEFQMRKKDVFLKSNDGSDSDKTIDNVAVQTETSNTEKEKILNIMGNDAPINNDSTKNSFQESKAKYISPNIIADAGMSIQSAVRSQVISYAFYFLGFGLFLYSLIFELFSGIINGGSFDELIGDSPALYGSAVLLIAGLVFRIKYLLRLNKAGRLFKKSSENKYCVKHDFEYSQDNIWGGCMRCLQENDPVKYEKIGVKIRLKQI